MTERRDPSGEVAARVPLTEAERRQLELDQAERWLQSDPAQRRIVTRALAAALVLHATILVAKMPNWGPDPVRVDAPQEQSMKVQFLRPPPPPPKAPPEPPKPVTKKVPRPDPTPDEPEPITAPPPPPVPSTSTAPPSPASAQDMGPIRVSPGKGPGLIKKVEPPVSPDCAVRPHRGHRRRRRRYPAGRHRQQRDGPELDEQDASSRRASRPCASGDSRPGRRTSSSR